MEVIIVFLALSALAAALFLLPVEAALYYGRAGEEDLLELEFFLWPRLRRRVRVNMIDWKQSAGRIFLSFRTGAEHKTIVEDVSIAWFREAYRKFTFWLKILSRVNPWISYLQKKTVIKKFLWKTGFGMTDPCLTGVAAGIIWSLKGYLVSWLYSSLRPQVLPEITVKSDFARPGLRLRLECRLSTRAGYIIYAGLRAVATLITSGYAGRIYQMR